MLEVSRVLAGKWNDDEVFPRISASLRRVLRQEYAALAVHDEKSGQLVRQAMDFPLRKGRATHIPTHSTEDPQGKTLREGEPLILSKSDLQDFPAGATDDLLAEGLQSLCCVCQEQSSLVVLLDPQLRWFVLELFQIPIVFWIDGLKC